jgi:hypothetical protein
MSNLAVVQGVRIYIDTRTPCTNSMGLEKTFRDLRLRPL